MDNIFLRNELSTADRAKALQVFQAQIQSRTIAANIISIGAGSNSKVVFVSRGSTEGVMRGMAVVTPDLKVRGVENLRVFDASVMPNLISANTNAPTMAIADKAVGLMMGETPPPPAVL